MEYPIPKASADAWCRHEHKRPQNPGLIFERFSPRWDQAYKDKVGETKRKGLEAVCCASEKADADLLKAWNTRWEALVRASAAEPFTLQTDWRFVAGLGSKGPLEVGFTFHRYGFPILPGSSVKGIARTWALVELADELGAEGLEQLDALLSLEVAAELKTELDGEFPDRAPGADKLVADFRRVFGTTSSAGGCVFFDAVPASLPELELDIMNPHFPDYYGPDKKPPTDSQSPRPVCFLTVAPGNAFRFAVGWRVEMDEEVSRLRTLAEQWLREGLMELGAGAKTSAGYGYFVEKTADKVRAPRPGGPSPAKKPDVHPKAPVVTARHTGIGRIKYDAGKPRVVNEEGRYWRLNWQELGMNPLGAKTLVEFEYEEYADRRYKVVRVTPRED